MKAFIIYRYGKKEKLHLHEIADPVVKDNDVLVKVHAASVNMLDSKIKNGDFKLILPYKTPLVLGHDVAGVITRIGSGVSRFKVGDEVYARPADHHIGTFAGQISMNEADVALKPQRLSMEEAASIPLVALTAWQALVENADLKKRQKVFIQAGSGGVGTIAIQLAKYLGATVATTTSTANVEWVKALGADVVIDYKKEDFETILNDYDVVLNSQDAHTLNKSLRVLKPGGKLISISGPPDLVYAQETGIAWPLKMVMGLLSFGVRRKAKQLRVDYSFLFMRANGSQLSKIAALIDAGSLHPVIDKVFPFEQTAEALAYVESGHAKGKVIIKVS
jgi:NADPH:quinone reductase-like Zn-dependent oxidoreductase